MEVRACPKEVKIYADSKKESFLKVIQIQREPAVLQGLELGECVNKWTPEYLCSVGADTPVKVHVSPHTRMDFINKNFAYRSLPFNELIKRASTNILDNFFFQNDEKYYLRSLGGDVRKDVANIAVDFPQLAADIQLPQLFERERFFSSVLRVASAGMQLWTHYDVMDNLLVQVRGEKRAVLYSPSDATYLYLQGDKSEVLDIDKPDLQKYPDFTKATPYECHLQPGDVLFIPALWFHNMTSLDYGVAVNVFWKNLDSSCYDNKDTYGNKDPVVASRAMQKLNNALKLLDDLPQEYRDFYARRMVLQIQNKAYTKPSSSNYYHDQSQENTTSLKSDELTVEDG